MAPTATTSSSHLTLKVMDTNVCSSSRDGTFKGRDYLLSADTDSWLHVSRLAITLSDDALSKLSGAMTPSRLAPSLPASATNNF